MVEEDPHAIFSIQFAIGPEVLVIPGSASVVALGAAVGMFEARPGTEGKLIAAGEHDATGVSENDLIRALAEEGGIKEEGFVGFAAALVLAKSLRNAVDEGVDSAKGYLAARTEIDVTIGSQQGAVVLLSKEEV